MLRVGMLAVFGAAALCWSPPVSAEQLSDALGMPSEVADPMRAWSLNATKLLVIMGMRAGGNSLNAAANQLNADARAGEAA